MPLNLPMWRGSSIVKKNQKAVGPPPDPTPYAVANPEDGAPYIPANYDYSPGVLARGKHRFQTISEQQKDWRQKGKDNPKQDRPNPALPAEEWTGYERESFQRSERDEHLNNGREGLPLVGQTRYHPALNPYWYRVPDERPQRAPHEWDFQRPFDQGVLGERTLNGMHYSEAQMAGDNMDGALKGMTPAYRRMTTFRLEPTQWGENTVAKADSIGPPQASFTSPSSGSYPSTYRLS